MNKSLLAVVFLFASFSLAQADLKIAVIDLEKAFDGYYKTKDLQERIEEKKAGYNKDVQEMETEYTRMQQDAKTLYDQVNNTALSTQARADADKALQAKNQDLLAYKSHINDVVTERRNEIQDEIFRRHKEILEEINKVINDYSGPQGFDLVIDMSPSSAVSGGPIVLYHSSKLTDITAEVLTRLNATAPPATASGTASSTPAPATPN